MQRASCGVGGQGRSGQGGQRPSMPLPERIGIASDSFSPEPVDIYLLNCSGNNGCYTAEQQEISSAGRTIAIDNPAAGNWKIVARSSGQSSHPRIHLVQEALLVKASVIDPNDSKHSNGESWALPLPKKQSDAQYAAFHITGAHGNEREKNGLLIAMTPLTRMLHKYKGLL